MPLTHFLPAALTSPETALLVDGWEPGWRHLSHWPGHSTPARYRAPTSTEMALRWAADEGREAFIHGLTSASNNHFDTDGLLAAWTVLNPRLAGAEKPHLMAAARAGDFGWYTSPKGVRLNLLVETYAESPESPLAAAMAGCSESERLQLLYGELLPRLPALLHEMEEQRPMWEKGWRELEAGFKQVRAGAGVFTDYPAAALSVYEGPPLPAMIRHSLQNFPRLLRLETGADGRRTAVFELDHYSWFDIDGNSRELRPDLALLAARLNQSDPGWRPVGMSGFESLQNDDEPKLWGRDLIRQFIGSLS